MDFLKELISSAKEQASERVSSIYTGTFIFSWVAVNWKVLAFLLFSDTSIESKLLNYSQYFPVNEWFIHSLIYPLLISLIIIIVTPSLNALADLIKIGTNLTVNYIKRRFSGWISPQESQKLLKRIQQLEDEQAPLFLKKDEEIERYKEANRKLENDLSSAKATQIQELELARNSIKKPLAEANVKIKSLEAELDESKIKFMEKYKEATNLNHTIQNQNGQIREMHNALKGNLENYPQHIQLKDQLAQAKSQVNGLSERINEMEKNKTLISSQLKSEILEALSNREKTFTSTMNRYEASILEKTSKIPTKNL